MVNVLFRLLSNPRKTRDTPPLPISLITSYYLSCATVYTNESVYGVVGTKLSNKVVGVLADFSNVLLYFGIDIAYMNVLFQQVVDIGSEIFNQGEFFNEYKTVGDSPFLTLFLVD